METKTAPNSRRIRQRVAKSTKNIAESYNRFKEYGGQHYTGMKVGNSHKWNYNKGVWKELKITPDQWELTYSVVKRRAGHAPEGSGVPVGTSKDTWSASEQAQHKQLIKILEDLLAELRVEPEKTAIVPLDFEYKGNPYKGVAIPVISSCNNQGCRRLDITLNQKHLGVIRCADMGRRITGVPPGTGQCDW